MIQAHPLPPASLRAHVTEYLPWASCGSWTSLFGGRTNSAWLLSPREGQADAVLKLYRSDRLVHVQENPLFPNDPDAEIKLLLHLKTQDFAPNLIAHFQTELGRCILYHSIPGERWATGLTEVADLIASLHQVPPPEKLRSIANGSEALLAQADKILARCKNASDLNSHRPTGAVAPTQSQVLLHGDIVPGNLIRNASGLHLIDWQCPAVGDPCEDIAIFLSPAMQLLYRGAILSAQEVDRFLSMIPAPQRIRYIQLAPFFHFRMAAYCLWQSQNERPDYADGLRAELDALGALP